MKDKNYPLWEIKAPDSEVLVHVLRDSNKIVIEQGLDMLLVDLEEAKELVGILKSAIDYAEEN